MENVNKNLKNWALMIEGICSILEEVAVTVDSEGYIVVSREEDCYEDVGGNRLQQSWDDFKKIIAVLRSNRLVTVYEKNTPPSPDCLGWDIRIKIPYEAIRV